MIQIHESEKLVETFLGRHGQKLMSLQSEISGRRINHYVFLMVEIKSLFFATVFALTHFAYVSLFLCVCVHICVFYICNLCLCLHFAVCLFICLFVYMYVYM